MEPGQLVLGQPKQVSYGWRKLAEKIMVPILIYRGDGQRLVEEGEGRGRSPFLLANGSLELRARNNNAMFRISWAKLDRELARSPSQVSFDGRRHRVARFVGGKK